MSGTWLRPLPTSITRPLGGAVLIAWVVTMGLLVHRSYGSAGPASLATDLARYGPSAVWRGVYYRGEKIGFTVSEVTRTDDGFELREHGTIQMVLLGQDSAATLETHARVNAAFELQSFAFSLDPGTGPTSVQGTIGPATGGDAVRQLALQITSAGVTRTESRPLREVPTLALNLPRQIAAGHLKTGSAHTWFVLDPATAQTAPMTVTVGARAIVRAAGTFVPAYRVEMAFRGLTTTSWITDTGDVVREESPLGLMTVQEQPERARGLAMESSVRADLLQASAVVPRMSGRIDEPRDIRRLRVRLSGATLPQTDLVGAGQQADGAVIELLDPRDPAAPSDRGPLPEDSAPEALIESDAPDIRAEAARVVGDARDDETKARRLTRHVNAIIEKKPTVSLPSALDVLRTRVGDCNEHTALFTALARASGLPTRIAVGLVFMRDAFYYHAWAEVYVRDASGGGRWLPSDPTLDQFPADRTHLRLARGGLDRQAAILPLVGRLTMDVLDMKLDPAAPRPAVGDTLVAGLVPEAMAPMAQADGTPACRCARAASRGTTQEGTAGRR